MFANPYFVTYRYYSGQRIVDPFNFDGLNGELVMLTPIASAG